MIRPKPWWRKQRRSRSKWRPAKRCCSTTTCRTPPAVNSTSIARRAFSVCYMDAATVDSHNHEYSLIFGDGALDPERL